MSAIAGSEVDLRPPALEAIGIFKAFGDVEVLCDVNLTVNVGEIHGLVGQNGAGKSTLMKIINGVYSRDRGQLRINGREVSYKTPKGARSHGISMVYQELSLLPALSVMDNLFLTSQPTRARIFIDEAECRRRAREAFHQLGVAIAADELVGQIPIGLRQMVEITKALLEQGRIIIFDEPTASLSHSEIMGLFGRMRHLRDRGYSMIYISHHLREVMEVCDRITVLRDGRVVLDCGAAETNLNSVVEAMVGRSLGTEVAWEPQKAGDGSPLLEVRDLTVGSRVRSVSFSVRRGEVLGLAGLMGSGRSEVVRAILGVDRRDAGEIILRGRSIRINTPKDGIGHGFALVPEERRRQGLVLGHSVQQNALLSIWRRLTRRLLIDDRKASELTARFIDRLSIATTGADQLVDQLSGGNQQKVVVARAMSTEPNVLLLDEPTSGIDVETKRHLLELVREAAAQGSAVVFVSSELAEMAAVCDRVLILHRGQVAGELDRGRGDQISEETLLSAIQPELLAS